MTVYNLKWKYAGKILDFANKIKSTDCKKKGLYIWVENVLDKEVFNYVGKATNCLIDRNLGHIHDQLALRYSIPEFYRRKTRYPKRYIRELNKSNSYFYIGKVLSSPDLLKELQLNVLDYLKSIDLYFCDLSNLTSKEISTLENQVIYDFFPMENSTVSNRPPASRVAYSIEGDLKEK